MCLKGSEDLKKQKQQKEEEEEQALAALDARLFEGLLSESALHARLPASLDETQLAEELALRSRQLETVDTALTARVRASCV